jgi:hypothetical protein
MPRGEKLERTTSAFLYGFACDTFMYCVSAFQANFLPVGCDKRVSETP